MKWVWLTVPLPDEETDAQRPQDWQLGKAVCRLRVPVPRLRLTITHTAPLEHESISNYFYSTANHSGKQNKDISPQRCPCLSLQNPWIYGRRDFAGVIKLRILRWQEYPGLSRWVKHHHKWKGEAEESESEKMWWWSQRSEWCNHWLWKWRKGPQGQRCRHHLETGKGKKTDSPL